MQHEEAFIRAFVRRDKRNLILDWLGEPREDFLAMLFDMPLDERYVEVLDPRMPLVEYAKRREAHTDKIHSLLRDRGAPSRCYVISLNNPFDGQEVDLPEVLGTVVGELDDTLLSCLPGRLVYGEDHHPNQRFILERRQ